DIADAIFRNVPNFCRSNQFGQHPIPRIWHPTSSSARNPTATSHLSQVTFWPNPQTHTPNNTLFVEVSNQRNSIRKTNHSPTVPMFPVNILLRAGWLKSDNHLCGMQSFSFQFPD